MYKFLFSLIFVIASSQLIAAQSRSEDFNRGELFTGYSGATLYTSDNFEPVENGFNVSTVYNFHKYVGIKADVSGTYRKVSGNYESAVNFALLGNYKANHSLYNAVVGVQIKDNRRESRVKPFGHVLVGYGQHRDKFPKGCPAGAICPPFNVDFEGTSLVVGGGVDVKITRRIDLRVIQFDLNPIFYKRNGESVSWMNNRFSSGIVFNF